MSDRYGMIIGTGRCGTNWLTDMFNYSAVTHCRYEPDGILSSPLQSLPNKWFTADCSEVLEARWDEAIRHTCHRIGRVDRPVVGRKVYFHRLASRTGLVNWPHRRRLGRACRLIVPRFRREEWTVPAWMGSQRRLEREAFTVIKILSMHGWASWLMPNRPEVPIIHIVRHPAGTLNSYLNRFVAHQDRARVERTGRERFRRILERRPEWAGACSDPDTMGITESEMWFWRWSTQVLHEVGEGRSNYLLILYEDLVRDPIGVTRAAYRHFGLEWTAEVERRVAASSEQSGEIASAWKDRVPRADLEIIRRIVGDSPMAGWWPETAPTVASG